MERARLAGSNKIRACWERGTPAVVGWLQIPSPLSAEALAICGYDGLVVDLQHSPIDVPMASSMFAAIEAGGAEPLARVSRNELAEIGLVLDAGAYGIIVPGIETADEAAAVADALYYPPKGRRSYGPRRPLLRHGAGYFGRVAQAVVSFVMIETRAGLSNLDAILSADGIDGVFIGPADLALALDAPPVADSGDARVIDAVRHVRERAHAHGRRAAIFCKGADFARLKIKEGFDLVSVAPDLTLMMDGAKAAVEYVRQPSIMAPLSPRLAPANTANAGARHLPGHQLDRQI